MPAYLALPIPQHHSLPLPPDESDTITIMSSSPRPILKRQELLSEQPTPLPFATCGALFSPHVHFPPTPSIVASTHPAHSPRTYDRKPIRVAPNACDLPPRGERKRLHSPPVTVEGEHKERGRGRVRHTAERSVKGSYFHPRAFEACEPEYLDDADMPSPPPLVRHGSSDESDDDSTDDQVVMTPPEAKLGSAMPPLVHGALHPPPGLDKPFARASSAIETKQRPYLVHSKASTVVVSEPREFSPALEGF